MKFLLPVITLLFLSTSVMAQQGAKQEKDALLLHMSYGYHLPGKDLSDRFGNNNTIGAALEFKLKSDFILGGNFSYLFGRRIKEDIMGNLFNERNELVGTDNHLAAITLSERGFTATGYLGKLFAFGHPQGALKVTIGGGVMQHKVRVIDDYSVFTQVLGEYQKGYDRLTNGLMLEQYIGYQWLFANRRINFSAGLVFNQGFTTSARKFNYNTGERDEASRLDLLNGLKVTWILPFYLTEDNVIRIY